MDINHATELLRHAEKIGRPAGDTPAVMRAAAAHIEDLERELRAAEIRLHDVATLCANVESELAEIKRCTYVAVTCNHVGRMERAEARVAELEAERAEREKQEPVFAFRRKGLEDFCTCSEERYNELAQKTSLFEVRKFCAAPPVTAPVKLTDEEIVDALGASGSTSLLNKLARAIETAVLRSNGFDIQPTEAGG